MTFTFDVDINKDGGLSTEYFLLKLEEANRQLQQYEQSAAPPGWSCHWDRYVYLVAFFVPPSVDLSACKLFPSQTFDQWSHLDIYDFMLVHVRTF